MRQGNAVIGQSGGPTCVINQTLVGAIEEAARHPSILRFYGARHGVRGMLDEDFVDLGAESAATLEAVARTPSAALGSVRFKPTREDCERLVEVFRRHEIRYFFYIGGNDTAETASIIEELTREQGYDFRVCHLPKTIDNDLRVTDHCPGYGSAARFVALAHLGDDLDNRALGGVKINVVMGRHAGFLTASSALARRGPDDGPHLIYVPERPVELEGIVRDIDRCLTRVGRAVVAVSEGIQSADGRLIAESDELDCHGNVQLSGASLGEKLAAHVKAQLGVRRVRADTFGYLQRSFPSVVSDVDAREAREVGAFGVRQIVSGDDRGGSVAIRRTGDGERYGVEYFLCALSEVARRTKSLDPAHLAEEGGDVTEAFLEYVRPLVGELPETGRLAAHPVGPRS